MEPLLPGDPERIGGYRCVARLGSGGMGEVFLVQADTGAPAALKLIHPDLADDPGFRARFAREVGAMRKVTGPYTAALLDAGDTPRPWLATSYLPGLSLQEAVTRHGPLSVEATRRLGAALAEALASIHGAGVVHRDLKPGNIMLTGDGPRVVDFGLAGVHDLTGTDGTFAGTPAYMAPERWSGGPAAPPADVFALGGVLVFCRTGAPPRHDLVDRDLTQDLPHDDQGLGAVIEACLATDPSQRPSTEQVASALSPGATGTDWLPPALAHEIAERTTMSLGLTAPSPGGAGPARRRVLAQIGAMGAVALASAGAVRALPGKTSAAPVLWTARATVVTGSELGPELHGRLLFLDRTVVTDSGPARLDLCCLDATGRYRWRRPLPPFERQTGGVVAALGSVWVRSGRETLVVDPGTGLVRRSWRRAFPGLGPAVAYGDALAYDLAAGTNSREGGTVYAHEPRSGRIVWERRIDGRPVSPLTVAGNTVYVVSASATGRWERVHALDSATGSVRWTSDHDDDVIRLKSIAPRYTDATLCVADGTVYVSVEGRTIHALDARTGAARWQARPQLVADDFRPEPYPTAAFPVVHGDALFLLTGDGMLRAFDRQDGRQRWSAATGADPFAVGTFRHRFTPPVARGLVFVHGADTVRALRAKDGRVRWEQETDPSAGEPVLAGGALHIPGRAQVTSHALTDGQVMRRLDLRRLHRPPTALAAGRNVLYVLAGMDTLLAVDLA
ncbi:PQQ-binding-like beta-propeller repeat protein [Actinomadura sp. B10D3]|uniref:serine/threonine-protein kinase n=1 Tax=Actinomadura sp. B10D3 TaxID=3153557 RepID=UPI00325DD068